MFHVCCKTNTHITRPNSGVGGGGGERLLKRVGSGPGSGQGCGQAPKERGELGGRKRGGRPLGRGGVREAPPSSHLRQVERGAPAGLSAMSAESAGPVPGPGPGPEPGPLCPEHGQALKWFCCSERRPVCAACTELGGRCQGHRIRPAEERAEELRVSGRGSRKAGAPREGAPGRGRRAARSGGDPSARGQADPGRAGPGAQAPQGSRLENAAVKGCGPGVGHT